MPETRAPQATEAHYRMLADVDQRRVFDRYLTHTGETPCLRVEGSEPADVSRIVWDMEAFGWVRRPADDPYWQLTDAGRAAREDGGL